MTSVCANFISKKFAAVMQGVFVVAIIFFASPLSVMAGWSEEKSRAEIHSKDAKEKQGILSMIKRKRDKRRLSDVERMARNEPNSYIRHQAISVLCDIDDPKSAEALADIALNATDEGDRQVAISGVSLLLKKERAVPVLIKGLKDNDSTVRIRAAHALAKFGDYSGEAILIEGARDSNFGVAGQAVNALGYVNTEASRALLKDMASRIYPGHYHAKAACRRLEYTNAPKENYLSMAREDLKTKYPDVHMVALEKLADLGTPEAMSLLYSVANDQAHPAFRSARNILLYKRFIKEEDFWTPNLTPPSSK
jgi:HEAT repeat protein